MEEEEEHLCKVETKEDNFYLLFRKNVEGDGFELYVTDGCAMWSSEVTDDMLQEMAMKVDMNANEYVIQTTKALTCQSSGKDCFIYQATRKDPVLEFSWKKQLDDGVKYQLGSVSLNLNQDNKKLMQQILDFAIRKICEDKDNTMYMKSEIEQLGRDRENALLRLEKCVASKEKMETDLMQKFVAVLNEKKAKIRRLQEVINQHPGTLPTKSQDSAAADDHEKDYPKKNHEFGNEDTDVESDYSEPQNDRKAGEKGDETTTSKLDSCLFKEEEDAAPVVKRRRKKQTQQLSRTPSKPVLPKVAASAKRTTSNASSSSTASSDSKQLPTRRSSRRKKSSQSFPDDVEDLFGDMA